MSLSTPQGKPLLRSVNLDLKPGESVLLMAPSGAGKTTLLRTILGYWPHAEGEVVTKSGARTIALPQKPYFPLGSLEAVLTYPATEAAPSREEISRVLELVGLGHLEASLDDARRWSNILSVGEQQRVALARAILLRPDILFLDEATSALDEAAEARLLRVLQAELPNAAIVSIGHRSSLLPLHDRIIRVTPAELDEASVALMPKSNVAAAE